MKVEAIDMEALEYAQALIRFDTSSHLSNEPLARYLRQQLEQLGFDVEWLVYENAGVPKVSLVARRGAGEGGLALMAHTDVVPALHWALDHGPFEPTVHGERLYGRGSCDMKGSLGCMLAAAALMRDTKHRAPLYIVCTSDEEVGFEGARHVSQHSELFHEMVRGGTRAVVGEPTRLRVIHGHKGSCAFRVVARGRAAHSSTRQGINANLRMIPYLQQMKALYDLTEEDPRWHDSRFDPPTLSWNIGINDHTAAANMTAAQSICTVHFRPMPGQDWQPLVDEARRLAREHEMEFELFQVSDPFFVEPSTPFVREILELTGTDRSETVSYGTDASMLGALKNLVICGPGDIAQAHTADEWIALEQLRLGTDLFARFITAWCC